MPEKRIPLPLIAHPHLTRKQNQLAHTIYKLREQIVERGKKLHLAYYNVDGFVVELDENSLGYVDGKTVPTLLFGKDFHFEDGRLLVLAFNALAELLDAAEEGIRLKADYQNPGRTGYKNRAKNTRVPWPKYKYIPTAKPLTKNEIPKTGDNHGITIGKWFWSPDNRDSKTKRWQVVGYNDRNHIVYIRSYESEFVAMTSADDLYCSKAAAQKESNRRKKLQSDKKK